MTDVIIMVDTRIGITGVLDGVIDLIGQETKGFRRNNRRWNGVNQDRRFQSDEFFVRRARLLEDLKDMKEICTDGTEARTGEITVTKRQTNGRSFDPDSSFSLSLSFSVSYRVMIRSGAKCRV